jgi:methylated-DNA-[protein]-cysteine S-methyltransferase
MKVTPELDRRFRDAAAATGDLDVGFDMVDTPIGAIFVGATPAGLCRISYDPEPERVVEILARTVGVRVLRAPRSVDETRRQLDEYFEHRRTAFDLPIDLRVADGFPRRVLDELVLVPYGEVTTYGELARRVEHPRAARAVGTIMNRNPIPIVLPCHRVVGASGSLTGYGGGLDRKEALLRLEGAIL